MFNAARTATIVGVALTAGLLFGACGGSTASPSASGPAEIVGPVMLDAATTTADVALGRYVTFALEDPAAWTIAADHAELVEITQGGEKDGAVFNPGLRAAGAGTVVVTATKSDGTTILFTLTIK